MNRLRGCEAARFIYFINAASLGDAFMHEVELLKSQEAQDPRTLITA